MPPSSTELANIAHRAWRAMAQLYGRPVPGGSGSLVLGAADQYATLRGGFLYVFTVLGGDAVVAFDSPTSAGAQQVIPAGASFAFQPAPAGQTPKLSAAEGPTAGGTLYWTAYQDVA